MNSTNRTSETSSHLEKRVQKIQPREVHYFDSSSPINTSEYTYKCKNTYTCDPYKLTIDPGCYLIELYGASGGSQQSQVNAMRYSNAKTISEESISRWGGNSIPKPIGSSGGAGGHVRATICLRKAVQAFLHIGGKGGNPQGGYNGGGSGYAYDSTTNGGGGGGSTDLRFEVDDVWHRVLVAAGGGGADDASGAIGQFNDGSGGCGGGLEGQGFWHNGQYKGQLIATQTRGFSFFQGEAYVSSNPENTFPNETNYDKPGAGGGWFGGFSGHSPDAGAGGGSSFVLHANAVIPKGEIPLYTEKYVLKGKKSYAFTKRKEYFFTDFALVSGIRMGNGLARITKIEKLCLGTKNTMAFNSIIAAVLVFYLI